MALVVMATNILVQVSVQGRLGSLMLADIPNSGPAQFASIRTFLRCTKAGIMWRTPCGLRGSISLGKGRSAEAAALSLVEVTGT